VCVDPRGRAEGLSDSARATRVLRAPIADTAHSGAAIQLTHLLRALSAGRLVFAARRVA
jgi:hypothetical protein